MIERTRITKADDVIIQMTIRHLKVILGEIDDLKKTISNDDEEELAEDVSRTLEYARTGKIAYFENAAMDAGLIGHTESCSVWNHPTTYGGKCDCGRWEAE